MTIWNPGVLRPFAEAAVQIRRKFFHGPHGVEDLENVDLDADEVCPVDALAGNSFFRGRVRKPARSARIECADGTHCGLRHRRQPTLHRNGDVPWDVRHAAGTRSVIDIDRYAWNTAVKFRRGGTDFTSSASVSAKKRDREERHEGGRPSRRQRRQQRHEAEAQRRGMNVDAYMTGLSQAAGPRRKRRWRDPRAR